MMDVEKRIAELCNQPYNERAIGPAATKLRTLATELLVQLPRHSGIPCTRCGGVCIEFTVPNDVWNTIVRRGGKERDDEYMCEACYRKAVEDWVTEFHAIRVLDAYEKTAEQKPAPAPTIESREPTAP